MLKKEPDNHLFFRIINKLPWPGSLIPTMIITEARNDIVEPFDCRTKPSWEKDMNEFKKCYGTIQ